MKIFKNILLSSMASISILSAGGDIVPLKTPSIVAEPTSSWSNEFQLYGLGIYIQGDTKISRMQNKADIDMTPSDVYGNLKMGAMFHYEGLSSNGWGVWLDYAFMNLGFDTDGVLIDGSTGFYQGIMEAFVKYRSPLEVGYIDYYGGIRWWHNDMDMNYNVDLGSYGTHAFNWNGIYDWYDPVLGARWTYPLNEKWSVRLRGDVGGFGIASDFTAAVEAVALYDINEEWQVKMSFKSLWVDYEEGTEGTADYFAYNTVNFGPILGITYKF
jgi:hypothetical protein